MKEIDGGAVVFNTHKGKKQVHRSEIAFVKADNKYLDFYTEQGIFTECTTLKALEAGWGNDWIRIHRNAIVCKSAIQSFNSVGRRLAVACQGKLVVLDVSRRHRPKLRRWLRTLNGVQP